MHMELQQLQLYNLLNLAPAVQPCASFVQGRSDGPGQYQSEPVTNPTSGGLELFTRRIIRFKFVPVERLFVRQNAPHVLPRAKTQQHLCTVSLNIDDDK